jgi:hypothetical protein
VLSPTASPRKDAMKPSVLMVGVFVGFLLASASAGQTDESSSQSKDLKTVREVRLGIAKKLKKGESLSGKAPGKIVDKLLSIPSDNPEMNARKEQLERWRAAKNRSWILDKPPEPQTTLLELDRWSAPMTTQGVSTVSVEIDSQPEKCDVYYREASSDSTERLFMGRTKVGPQSLSPTFYYFQCECPGNGHDKDSWELVDCATSAKVSFSFTCRAEHVSRHK